MCTTAEKKIQINKRLRGQPREELEKLNKTELIDKVVRLEAYNTQLRNLLQKKLNREDSNDVEILQELQLVPAQNNNDESKSRKISKKRKFDFSNSHKRHVLLKLLYFGWDYQGFAVQEDSNDTIEHHLFEALTRTCLIPSRASCNYHRCGRTDKEVSAYCQVISLDLRSKFPEEKQLSSEAISAEIDYCGMLNRVLPKNIQCITWMPLRSAEYSARFDCLARTYRYYFPEGDLNIEAMRAGCKLLQRHGDFRNFCKMDVHNGVTNYVRNLQSAIVEKCPNETEDGSGYTMYYLEIKANAFLWHQIRCIMAVLLLIGQSREEPGVINELLNVEKNPCKPQYTPAIGLPLNLFQCEFRRNSTRRETVTEAPQDDITEWIYDEENLYRLIENVQSEWTQFSVKCTMIRNVLHSLQTTLRDRFNSQSVKSQVLLLQDSVKPREYQKLLTRKCCESLENRIDHFVKKQRLVVTSNDEVEISNDDT